MDYTTIKNKQRCAFKLLDPLRYSINDFAIQFGDAVIIRMKDDSYFILGLDEIALYSENKEAKIQQNLKAPVAIYELAEMGFRLMNYYYENIPHEVPFLIMDSYCNKVGKRLKVDRIAFVDEKKFLIKMSKKHIQQNIDTYFKKESPVPRNMKFYGRSKITMPVIYMPGEFDEINKVQELVSNSRSLIAESGNVIIDNVAATVNKIDDIVISGDMSNMNVDSEIQLTEST
ncbi:MAG: hypothetical protein KIT33_10435 [Candidatus Kapabacteria bacterium]|nr:hypothetical protein [Ignavibacteriota bacterium]MCW5885376.1 hypothetical protein [Candidatus Kapabacteria bacterium]